MKRSRDRMRQQNNEDKTVLLCLFSFKTHLIAYNLINNQSTFLNID